MAKAQRELQVGDEAVCNQCERAIVWGGERWKHRGSGAEPQHAAEPRTGTVRPIGANDLNEEINLPGDIAPAVMTGRPQLLALVQRPNGLTAEETKMVLHALGVYIATNQRLQRQITLMEDKITSFARSAQSMFEVSKSAAEEARLWIVGQDGN